MVAGGNTFISAMLKECGFTNIFDDIEERYPQTTLEELESLKPDLIFLSSEPYEFKTQDAQLFKTHFPRALIKIVDGEMFSWYGSRIILSVKYLQKLTTEIDLIF